MSNTCGGCAFFQENDAGSTVPNPSGVCTCDLPKVQVFMAATQGVGGPRPNPLTLTVRPTVAASDLACKEFRPKPTVLQ